MWKRRIAMYNPYEADEPMPIFCERCGDEIETDWLNIYDGKPYCDICKAEIVDEDGDDDDWREKSAGDYIAEEKAEALAEAQDRAFDEWRDRRYFGC